MGAQEKRKEGESDDLAPTERESNPRRAWARKRVEGARQARRRVVWALGAMGAAGALVYIVAIVSVAGAV